MRIDLDALTLRYWTHPLPDVPNSVYVDIKAMISELHRVRQLAAIVQEMTEEGGIEYYCDVNPEDCDHCIVVQMLKDIQDVEYLERGDETGKGEGDVGGKC